MILAVRLVIKFYIPYFKKVLGVIGVIKNGQNNIKRSLSAKIRKLEVLKE